VEAYASIPYCSDSVYVKTVTASQNQTIPAHSDKALIDVLLPRISETHLSDLKKSLAALYDLEINLVDAKENRDHIRIDVLRQIGIVLAKVNEIDTFLAGSKNVAPSGTDPQKDPREVLRNFRQNFLLRLKDHLSRGIESLVDRFSLAAQGYSQKGVVGPELLAELKDIDGLLSQMKQLTQDSVEQNQKKMMEDLGQSVTEALKEFEAHRQ
jgi:hypothetical protein